MLPTSKELVLGSLRNLTESLDLRLAPVVAELEEVLGGLEGHSFGSLEANQAVTREVAALLQRLGMRVRCPGCGEPAILRCAPVPRMPHGSFQFEHTAHGRPTRHRAMPAFPGLTLVPAPPDKRRATTRG